MLKYKVADHLVELVFETGKFDESLLPNFVKFVAEDDDKDEPVCRVVVQEEFANEELRDEIGQFDCGGCNHGVYLMPDGGYAIEISDVRGTLCATLRSNADFSECKAIIHVENPLLARYGLNNCMMMSYAFSTATKQTLLMHSSVIRKDGYGYMMTAPSGTGKSTHTHLWYENIPGCDLMNDDNPIVRVIDGQAIIYGSPWSGKTPCYRNINAPIGGIVRIKQEPKNSIRRMNVIESFATLLPAMSSMKWDKRVYGGVCDTVTALVASVGVYELGCLPNAEAALLCYSTIRADK